LIYTNPVIQACSAADLGSMRLEYLGSRLVV
jgi:hypothetical protein